MPNCFTQSIGVYRCTQCNISPFLSYSALVDACKERIAQKQNILKKCREEKKEFVSILLLLSREDRAVLLSNASAFKVRMDIEKNQKIK